MNQTTSVDDSAHVERQLSNKWQRFRRPMVLATAMTTTAELVILLVFGIWMFPDGSLVPKALWTLGLCGIGMGVLSGWLVGRFVSPYAGVGKAITATTAIMAGTLGIGCNTLCFVVDSHVNHFGAQDAPALWLLTGLVLSVVGGVALGTLLFTSVGKRLLTSIGL